MITKLRKLPPSIKEILKMVSAIADHCGFKVYLVGGIVRDLILGRANLDLDIVVEGDAIVLAKKIAEHFKSDFQKHHSFGTATVYLNKHKIDFATARREHYSHWGVLPRVHPAHLRDDLFRRDFTINAMAVSLDKANYAEVIDPYGGLPDLKKGLIRILHKMSFYDDPTRILRAIRFEQRFHFKIEKQTARQVKEAIGQNALTFVHPHRLRDEIILLLKEERPYRDIKRIKEFTGFSFMERRIQLKRDDFKFIRRIEKALITYEEKFKKHRKLDCWIIYLAAILINVPAPKIQQFLNNFDLRKGQRLIISSIKKNIVRLKKLDKKLKPHKIYRVLNPLSFESILFFYAYYQKKWIRENTELYLDKLVNIRLKTRGGDLEKIGIKPSSLYSKLLQKLLYAKMDKGLQTKQQEIEEAKRIFKKLLKAKIS